MQQSTSWRLTAPLRWASGHFRRIVRGTVPPAPVQRGSYADWAALYDSPGADAYAGMGREVDAWPVRPRLSVLLPFRGDDGALLCEKIASIQSQIYGAWELHIVHEGAADSQVKALLHGFGQADARIKHGSAGALGTSLSGDWVVWLEPGCTVRAHTLFCIAKEVVEHPEARMIYADEDRIDAQGARCCPSFKPDWNIDLFLSGNLFSPLGAVQASLFDAAGGLLAGVAEGWGQDLALRCVERVEAGRIRHIPRVLCHGDGAPPSDEARRAGVRALDRHFERAGVAAKTEAAPCGYRVRYALPAPLPLVSLIIPTRNAVGLVRQCIESIVLETAYPNYEILLVDNGSDDPEALAYFASLDAQPGITVIRDDRPFNYSALNNAAVAQARGELIGLLNNDIEVISSDWLGEMVSLALQPGVGAVGAKLLYPDMTIQHGGVVLGIGGMAGHAHKHLPASVAGHGGRAQLVQNFSAVTAACLIVRKSLYEQVGGLDEEQLGVAYNDVDFCLRLREAGYRNVWTPYAELLHHESASRGLEVAAESRDRLARESAFMRGRWASLIARDPAYNPNLTLDTEDFDLAWPPRDTRSAADPTPHP